MHILTLSRGSLVGRASDCKSVGRGFKSHPRESFKQYTIYFFVTNRFLFL
jgi:hypothetical protein